MTSLFPKLQAAACLILNYKYYKGKPYILVVSNETIMLTEDAAPTVNKLEGQYVMWQQDRTEDDLESCSAFASWI